MLDIVTEGFRPVITLPLDLPRKDFTKSNSIPYGDP